MSDARPSDVTIQLLRDEISRRDRQLAQIGSRIQLYADVVQNMEIGLAVWAHTESEESVGSPPPVEAGRGRWQLIATNPAASKLSSRRDLLRDAALDHYPDLAHAPVPDLFEEVLEANAIRDLGEVRYGDDKSPDAVFVVKVFPLPNRCVGVTFYDITDKKQLEEQLSRSQRVEAVGRLAGGIAHDFNNILTAISGYIGFLGDALAADDPAQTYVREIEEAASRASRLTAQLLAFSRRRAIKARPIHLCSLLGDLDEMMHRVISEDIELLLLTEEGPCVVKADPGQIEQVVMNLVVNARDAMPTGGQLIIESGVVQIRNPKGKENLEVPDGDYAVLIVSDTGSGMTAQIKERIFEPFFTTKGKGGGTGLGLATVHGIVKQHGGHITVASQPGEGTTFCIYLPIAGEEAGAEEVRKPAVAKHGIAHRILLVEDEAAVRNFASEALGKLGYVVEMASSGSEALRLLKKDPERRFDLLLTDVVMPSMSGKQLADELRSLQPEVRVLFMSGYADEYLGPYGVLEDGIDLIEKPFSMSTLARKVGEALA